MHNDPRAKDSQHREHFSLGGEEAQLQLEDLIDVDHFQAIMEDFHRLTGLPMSLIDLQGRVLAGVGWQRICTDFHRVHPETKKNCLESDLHLSSGVPSGEFRIYQCKNNMWDIVTPIMVEGTHFANIFMGQFFFEEEKIDLELYRRQARCYGFDEEEYLKALQEVPRFKKETVDWALSFLSRIAHFISNLGHHSLQLSQELKIRQETEEALRLSEQKFRSLVEKANDIIFTGNQQWDFYYVSPNWQHLLGHHPEEVIGRNAVEFVHPEDVETLKEAVQELLRTGLLSREVEYRARLQGGGWKWHAATLSLLSEDNGETILLGVARDISERKDMEQQLRYQKNVLEGVINGVTDILGIQYPDHTIERYNQAYYQLMGVTPEEARGQKCYQVLGRQEECSPCAVSKAVASKQPAITERYLPEIGRYFWCRGNPVLDEKGEVVRVVEQVRDITEQKEYESRLRKERDYMFRLFDAMQQYVIVDSPNYRIEYLNEAARQAFGELEGKVCYRELGKEAPCPTCPIPYLMKEGAPETVYYSIEANHRVLEGSATRLVKLDDSISIIEVLEDVTERRRAEERARYLYFHDRLTGLYNRSYLEETMEDLDKKGELPVSLIMVDLNGLKLINDTYGYRTGDLMLQEASQTLQGVCGEPDVIARWGGDEFVILMPGSDWREAEKVYLQIKELCGNLLIEDLPVSVAVGMSIKEDAQKSLKSALKEAEDHMYREKISESRSEKSNVLNTLLKALAEKSYETEAHTRRMEAVALQIGEKVGLPDTELNRLRLLITLHDIGKINLPEELLTKQGPLEDNEWEVMKKHPETGYRIARATENFSHVAEEILCHHERWDGGGYPRGLQGEDIPLLARITAIADAYEVMSNGRPYKKALNREQIYQEFCRCAGSQFDPQLVEVFLSLLEEEGA